MVIKDVLMFVVSDECSELQLSFILPLYQWPFIVQRLEWHFLDYLVWEVLICYDLSVRYPPQTHVLNTWTPPSGTLLGGSRNFRRQDITRRNGLLEECLWRLCKNPSLFLSSSLPSPPFPSLSLSPIHHNVSWSAHPPYHDGFETSETVN